MDVQGPMMNVPLFIESAWSISFDDDDIGGGGVVVVVVVVVV